MRSGIGMGILFVRIKSNISDSILNLTRSAASSPRDPIEEQGGLNLYAFVGNAPIFKLDELGRSMIAPGANIWHPSFPISERNPTPSLLGKTMLAFDELLKAYNAMNKANVIGGDKYFHCVGMCKATRRSDKNVVIFLAKAKEVFDLIKDAIKNGRFSPTIQKAQDSLNDMVANSTGIDCPTSKTCEECCCPYKVKGIK